MAVLVVLLSLVLPAPASAAPSSDGWTHRPAYALDPASPEVAAHPEWILKDGAGNRLYVGSAYAADFGNPAYRSWWIAQASGTADLYIDDVAMERRVTYSWGSAATPRDPRTNFSMSETTWQRYMADFMTEVRAALPASEIAHDVVWQKGSGTSNLRRQLDAADHVAIEGGFGDPLIVAGTGRNGWQSLAAFVEAQQAAGRGVILGGAANRYVLANSLLVDRGGLALGADAGLGAPTTGRWTWFGVWRRDFANGLVLVNEPGTAPRTLELPPGYADLDGVERTSVTLTGGTAVVLAKLPPPPPPPAPTPPAIPVAELPPPAPVATPTAPRPGTTPRRPGKVTAHTAGARGPKDTATTAALASTRVYGRVRGAVNGQVRVTVQRRRGSGWATVRRTTASVTKRGSYTRDISRLPRGSYRVSARFLGTGTARPSASGSRRQTI